MRSEFGKALTKAKETRTCPMFAKPFTSAMAAARFPGGRGMDELIQPSKMMPPEHNKTMSSDSVSNTEWDRVFDNKERPTAKAHAHAEQRDILPGDGVGGERNDVA